MNLSAEIRNWLTLILAVIGACITIKTYLNTQKQRRLENSFRIISMFKESLLDADIQTWNEIFHASSEPVGAVSGYFVEFIDGKRTQRPFSDLFCEGAPDNGAIGRMAELFDLISYEAINETIELRVVYFQLGQLMDTIYSWLLTIHLSDYHDKSSFLEENFPDFAKLYTKKLINNKWAKRTYAHIG